MRMVLWGNLAWHPAAKAWQQVAPTAPGPESIEVLHRENGTGTYRLVGAGPSGTPIIARRSGITKAVILRTLYSKILSRLPIPVARYCAFRAEPPGFAWVFLEERGGAGP